MKGLNCRSFWAKLFPNKKIVCIKFSNFDFFASCCIAQPIIIRKSFFVEKRKENVAAKKFQIGNQYFIFTFLINTFCWEKDDIFRSIQNFFKTTIYQFLFALIKSIEFDQTYNDFNRTVQLDQLVTVIFQIVFIKPET